MDKETAERFKRYIDAQDETEKLVFIIREAESELINLDKLLEYYQDNFASGLHVLLETNAHTELALEKMKDTYRDLIQAAQAQIDYLEEGTADARKYGDYETQVRRTYYADKI